MAATAADFATKVMDAAKQVVDNALDLNKNSLTAYARPTTINSRVYIDGGIFQEPIINPLLKAIHTMYAGFIVNAMQMNRLVTAGKSVKELLNVVSNESVYEDIGAAFESDWEEEQLRKVKEEMGGDKPEPGPPNTKGEIVNLSDGITPVGKIVELTLTNPENEKASVKLNVLVQLIPYVVSESIAWRFITADALPGFFQRFIQWSVGEISFWRDFVFNLDIVNDRRKAQLEDKEGILAKYIRDQWNARFKLWDNIDKDPNARKRNIASTVLIMSEQSLLKAKLETNIDFNNEHDRNRFFTNSLCMMVVIVDPMYNHVKIYFNGLDDYGTYNFDQFTAAAKKGDSSLDLLSTLSAFSKGAAPKF